MDAERVYLQAPDGRIVWETDRLTITNLRAAGYTLVPRGTTPAPEPVTEPAPASAGSHRARKPAAKTPTTK